jgi:hypothetical protein
LKRKWDRGMGGDDDIIYLLIQVGQERECFQCAVRDHNVGGC